MKTGLKKMPPFFFALAHLFCSLVLIVVYGVLTSKLSLAPANLLLIASAAGFSDSFLGILLFMFALKREPAHKVTPIANSTPFWGAMWAVLVLNEKASFSVLIAGVLVLLGVYLLGTRRGLRSIAGSPLALLSALGAGAIWGMAETVPTKYCLTHGMSPVTFQTAAIGSATLAWGFLAITKIRKVPFLLDRATVGLVLAVGFTNGFLGWLLWLGAIAMAPASILAYVRGLTVPFGFLLSLVFFQERSTLRSALGSAMIFASVALSTIGY